MRRYGRCVQRGQGPVTYRRNHGSRGRVSPTTSYPRGAASCSGARRIRGADPTVRLSVHKAEQPRVAPTRESCGRVPRHVGKVTWTRDIGMMRSTSALLGSVAAQDTKALQLSPAGGPDAECLKRRSNLLSADSRGACLTVIGIIVTAP